ncbi:MAG: NAD-binding protein, partial [Gammaproteobacteria bacterium]|nr:NAD-binding protein [Gammaproteobacteria bacterium]
GAGLLLGGVPGVAPAKVVIIGGGVVGKHAAEMAVGLGADVTVLDRNLDVLNELDSRFDAAITTLYSTTDALEATVTGADLVIGAVLIPGARAPHVISREMVKSMKTGSVIVDIAVDQGGCVETTKATDYSAPTYVEEGVVHFAVTNIPAAVPRSASQALSAELLPYVMLLLEQGLEGESLESAVNVKQGRIVHPAVELSLRN